MTDRRAKFPLGELIITTNAAKTLGLADVLVDLAVTK